MPEKYRDEVRLGAAVRGNSVTVIERQPPWREGIGPEWASLKIAQLRYDSAAALWSLYWPDSNTAGCTTRTRLRHGRSTRSSRQSKAIAPVSSSDDVRAAISGLSSRRV